MEVLPGTEGLLHHLVAGDVSQQPQLDLGVVGVHQQVPRRRHEHPAHLAAQLRAGGDVLEVGLRGFLEPDRGPSSCPEDHAFQCGQCAHPIPWGRTR